MQSKIVNTVKDWIGSGMGLAIIAGVIAMLVLAMAYWDIPRVMAAIWLNKGGAPTEVVAAIVMPFTAVLLALAIPFAVWMWLCKRT